MSEPVKFYAFKKGEPAPKGKLPDVPREKPFRFFMRSRFSRLTPILCLCSFVLSGAGLLDALYPFGIAWFAALSFQSKKHRPLLLFSVAAGYLWFVPELFAMYASVLLAECCCFLFYPALGNRPQYYLPVTVFTSVVVIRGLFLVFGGISDTLLVITLFESILAAGFSFILYRASEVWQLLNSMEKPTRGELLCILVFVGGLLLGLRNVTVYSVSPANIVMCLMILSAALLGGIGGGAAVGAVLGVIPSLAAMVSPAAIGMYAFSGFTAGLFVKFRRPGIIFGYLLGNILLSLYLLNSTLLISSVVETLLSAVLFLAIPKGIYFRLSEMLKGDSARNAESYRGDEYAIRRLDETGKHLGELRDSLSRLYSDNVPPSEKNVASILEHISSHICAGCSLKDVCWQTDFSVTYKELMRIFALSDANDGITVKELPEGFRRRCCHYKEMTAAVNCLCELYRKNEYWQQQIIGSRSLALSQLDHTVDLLHDLTYNIGSQRAVKELIHHKLCGELRKNGVRIDKVTVESMAPGELVLQLKSRHCLGERRCGKEIGDALAHLTGKSYSVSECRCAGNRNAFCLCRFQVGNGLSLHIDSVQLIKEGSALCGDTEDTILLADAKEALILSDGMGSGAKARKESEFTVSIVKKVLECGLGRDYATGIVRYMMLMERKDDVYATVDLCIVDRIRREAEFVKLGAGASYLCTPGKGMKIIGGEPLKGNAALWKPARVVREELHHGDIIIMASDGITEAAEDRAAEDWLIPLVEESCGEEPKIIGERIANKAVLVGGGRVKDDITVTVARVI